MPGMKFDRSYRRLSALQCEMPPLFPGERFRHIGDHLPLRRHEE
jgi:hypothetical protein